MDANVGLQIPSASCQSRPEAAIIHLKSSVHLHKEELPANRVHNELHGSRALVPHGLRRGPWQEGHKIGRNRPSSSRGSGRYAEGKLGGQSGQHSTCEVVPLRHSLLLLRCGCGSPRSPLAVKKFVIKAINSVSKGCTCTTCHIRLIQAERAMVRTGILTRVYRYRCVTADPGIASLPQSAVQDG